jgi:hypothetical protein
MRKLLLVVCLTFGAARGFGQARLTAFVYDYSHSDKDLIKAAEERASAVLNQAGMFVDWKNCWLPDDCEGTLKAVDVVVTLESKPRLGLPVGALGQSLLAGDDVYSAYARVFVQPIMNRAATANIRPEYLLGYTMTHEIAHLVLGPAHSAYGLMRKRWSAEEEGRIRAGSLRFAKDESAALRLGMSGRLASARGATSVAGLKAQ